MMTVNKDIATMLITLGVYYPRRNSLPVIVMEKMDMTLRCLLEEYSNIPMHIKMYILNEVCFGLCYLHNNDPPIVHRDLSTNNILLGTGLVVKISDMGVAKVMSSDNHRLTMTALPGTPDFMPPETLSTRPVYGPALDVFSFGAVTISVITQQWPEPTAKMEFNTGTDQFETISEMTRRQKYLKLFGVEAAELVPIVTDCLKDNHEKRPSVMEVSKELKRLQDNNVDGVAPSVWWAEVQHNGQSTSPLQQVCCITYVHVSYKNTFVLVY